MCLPNLQNSHRVLALRSAMSLAYKLKNYIYSSFFAKKMIRIIENYPNVAKDDVKKNA